MSGFGFRLCDQDVTRAPFAKSREGWGTPCAGYTSEIKGLGHPPFFKKIEHHIHMVAIDAEHYNFARIHKTLGITPAMAAGLSDHVWSLEEIVLLAG